MNDTMTPKAELGRRLDRHAAGEEEAWADIERARAAHAHLAGVLDGGEQYLRRSLLAHHAMVAKRTLTERGTEGLRAWADDQTDRLLRGTFLCRSTSLMARARGELEHEVVGELVQEVNAFLRLIEKGGA
jgi:hypothetical protein